LNSERWKQIDQLMQAALERKPEDRSAFLDEVCDDDQVLHREVESLISYESQASGFLEQPALEG
jgi:hypothetical protein